jgi:uncharacterized membrane protein
MNAHPQRSADFSPWRTTSELFSAGGLECLGASVSYAVSYIYMDRFLARQGIGAIVLSACQLAAAAVMLAVALVVSGVRAPQLTAENVAAIAVLGIAGTGFAYVLNYQIITSDGATVASTVTYLLPVVAIVLGVLVLNETITAMTLGGIALVLAGVALTRRPAKPPDRTPQETPLSPQSGGQAASARSYQVPGLPPRWAGSAGPTGTNSALASTFCDATFSSEVAALSVCSPCRAAASRHSSSTVAVATPRPAACRATR